MTFAGAIEPYHVAGWRGIIPVPPGAKHPPPNRPHSYTGADGIDTTPDILAVWATTHADHSIALRIPRGVIALDIDHYTKDGKAKTGGHTFADLETKWGALPATWASTARGTDLGVGMSRTLFYRVPDQRYTTKLPDIEILQYHHRYCVVWPSVNPDFHGRQYRWYGPDGLPADRVPKCDEFPMLPDAWVAGLAEGASAASPVAADRSSGGALLAQLAADDRPMCAQVMAASQAAVADLSGAAQGSRHDIATGRTYQLIALGAVGHPGIGPVLDLLDALWAGATPGEDRSGEFARMLLTAARKAVTAIGMTEQVDRDPCALGASSRYAGLAALTGATNGRDPAEPAREAAPADDSVTPEPTSADPAPDVRAWSVREFIGAHAFEPHGAADQTLAHQAWERMWPGLRYTWDAGTWLLRTPDRWELRDGAMHRWAASVLGDLMPTGDPSAEKGSEQQLRAARRAKFITNGSAGSIADKMLTLVAAGDHPCSAQLAELDTEPEILWSGGVPWDLRRGTDVPTRAQIDPTTPHLRTAAVIPAVVPTPRWDDFLASVWPDPEIRWWAMRVLSIGLTGYPDAALPILLGDTGRGKTQVIELLLDVLGTYGLAADPRLLGNTDQAHASIVIALQGRRLAFIDEGPRNGASATERLKQLTGGGRLTGNRMRSNPVEFRPTHTLVLTTNDAPSFVDPAVRRRVRLIPCEGNPEAVYEARSAISRAAWRAERPGVLAMMMTEAARWLADRRSATTAMAPLSIRYTAENLASEQDLVRAWIEAEMVPDQWGTKSAELFPLHAAWRRATGGTVITMTKFGRALSDLGYPVIHREDANYRGLRHKYSPPAGPPPSYTDASGTAIYKINQHMYTVTPANSANTEVRRGEAPHLPETGAEPTPQTRNASKPAGQLPLNSPADDHETSNDHENVFDRSNIADANPSGMPASAGPSMDGLGTSAEQLSSQSDQGVSSSAEGLDSLSPTTDHTTTRNNAHSSNGVTSHLTPNEVRENGGNCSAVQPKINSRAPQRATPDKIAKAAAKAAERELAKIARAAAREQAKADAKAAKIAEAAGPTVALPAYVLRGQPPVSVSLSVAADVVRAAVARDDDTATVDIESSAYPIGHRLHTVRSVQLGDLIEAVDFDPHDPEQAAVVSDLIARAPKLRAFSATADLAPLAYAGLVDHERSWERMYDTVIPAKLADPAGAGSDSVDGLKALSAVVLGADAVSPAADAARTTLFTAGGWLTKPSIDTPAERNGWAQVPTDCATMVTYAASDVLDTAALARRLPDPGPALWERERTVQRLTARISYHGVPIDGAKARVLLDRHQGAQDVAAHIIRGYGIENPASGPQVAAALTQRGAHLPRTAPSKKFPAGQPSVAEAALTPMAGAPGELGVLVRSLLEFNSHKNAIGTFLKPYVALCEYGDGRARPTIYTMEADTGRMSCVRPNFQNIPREGGFRSIITADQGYMIISADFSGVELRVAAALSQDTHLLQIILSDDAAKALDPKAKSDIHWKIAQAAYGPGATKAQRYNVKRGVFGRLYGAGIANIANTLGITETEAAMIVEILDSMTPGLKAWDRQLRNAVKAGNTHFPSYAGRVIHLDRREPHKAGNYCIQGTGRELLVDGLLRWSQTKWGDCVLFPVHDEVCALVPAADAAEATETLVDCMRTELFGVPILAAPSEPSFAWADAA